MLDCFVSELHNNVSSAFRLMFIKWIHTHKVDVSMFDHEVSKLYSTHWGMEEALVHSYDDSVLKVMGKSIKFRNPV